MLLFISTSSVFSFKFASLFIGRSLLNFQQWSHKASFRIFLSRKRVHVLFSKPYRNESWGQRNINLRKYRVVSYSFPWSLMNRELKKRFVANFSSNWCHQFHALLLINERLGYGYEFSFVSFYSDEIRSRQSDAGRGDST